MAMLLRSPSPSSYSMSNYSHQYSSFSYDVFLSFRGEDTRKAFTDHLHSALKQAGIRIFLDDDAMERGRLLKPELEKAIYQSQVSLIVFSKSYATSKWCLDEVLMIMEECDKSSSTNKRREVVPVFYHIDPTEVRNQTGCFKEAFKGYDDEIARETDAQKKKALSEKVEAWRSCLKKAGSLIGMVLGEDGYEAECITNIVNDIRKKVDYNALYIKDKLVGMKEDVAEIESWLQDPSPNSTTLLIGGMGGTGKTTIAKLIFNMHCHEYDGCCFLKNINENGLLRLQSQLLSTICKSQKEETIWNEYEGTTKIINAICNKKVLLVLDDVAARQQLNALLGPQKFCSGSKVIITTKQTSLSTVFAVPPKVKTIRTLSMNDSVELFCLHAFPQKQPIEPYYDLILEVLRYSEGLPLALEVLGTYLCGKRVDAWKDALCKLKSIPLSGIQKVLKLSYEYLEESDKDLFLHIACFFVGEDKDFIVKLLAECNLYPTDGIVNLTNRSLLYIELDGKVGMHQLIRDMGKEVVRQESPKDPGKRSRLWDYEDCVKVLQQNLGTKKVEGLTFDLQNMKEANKMGNSKKQSFLASNFKIGALEKMKNLMLLQLNYVTFFGKYNKLPRKLRFLRWHGFSLKSIPVDIPFDQLVVLDMSYSKLKRVWDGYKCIESLKILNLSYSVELIKTPDFGGLPGLESLILKGCTSLFAVDESITYLEGLVLLDLTDCICLRKVPCLPRSLKSLQMSSCPNLGAVARFEFPGSTSLPSLLVKLNISNCNLFDTSFPNDWSNLVSLAELNIDGNNVTFLPKCVQSLPRLSKLEGCKVGEITSQTSSSVVEGNILRDVLEAPSSSSSPNDNTYDVFISFRGTDTRLGFTAHLHRAFKEANIETFYDDKEIETELYLKPELKRVMEASRAYVVVLSKTYTSSTQCLEELVSVLEQRRKFNRIVIPIFYHVEPTHFRGQHPMAEHRKKMEAETNAEVKSQMAHKIDIWSIALTEVSYIKGMHSKDRLETQIIEKIVEDVNHSLPLRNTLPDLIGVDYPVRSISAWLNDGSTHTADILTISGISGIGKTSLAEYIYGLHCHLFQRSSFIDDINRKCHGQSNKLPDLQKQLYAAISKTDWIHVDHVSVCTSAIENAVACKKVFLVLDDIDNPDQLDALLGNKGFHPGSKIIITTKDASLIERCALFSLQAHPKHTKILLKDLNETSSLQLFSYHAFGHVDPTESYKQVSKKLAEFCNGLPLALKVLGRSLFDRDEFEWEDCLENLNAESDSDTEKVLRFSFDSLPSKNAKELFKYIACFFVGKDRDSTETILKACEVYTKIGITNLIDRCLLTIGPNNELMMHELLQEIGRTVVQQESLDPWERSRLWCHEESFQVLNQNRGEGNLKGIVLDSRMLEKEKLVGSLELETKVLSKMDNLMLLQLNYVPLRGSYTNFPQNLRWLCMHHFLLEHVPSDLPMENLVALDMSYSKFKSFDMSCGDSQRSEKTRKSVGPSSNNKRFLGSLKVLNLSFCKQLRFVGGFIELPSLERLMLTNCIGLIRICESIEHCDELILVDLSCCNKLENFLRSIGKLKKLQTLFLDGCGLHEFPVVKRDVDTVDVRLARNSSVNSESSSSAIVETMPSNLNSLGTSLLTSLVSLSLANNNLSNDSFTTDFSSLSMLKVLFLDGNPIVSLPDCVKHLPMLEKLSMKNCNMLGSIEGPPHTLSQLILDTYDWQHNRYSFLRKIKFKHEMSPLKLSADPFLLAPSLFEIDGIVKIQPMSDVEEKLLHSLGWSNLEFVERRHVETYDSNRGFEGFKSQMYYEFGVFSTIYGGEVMPNWITDTSEVPSISVTIPSSPNKLRGLNFCYVQKSGFSNEMFRYSYDEFFSIPPIKITNKTKNHTWIYKHYIDRVGVDGKYLTVLTHWMFGMDEMEAGDHITINITNYHGEQVTRKCGIGLVYNDASMEEEEEEDVWGYYKSWNHIIGGDLSAFQLTTGDYFLHRERFMQHTNICLIIGFDVRYKEMNVPFRAFSQRKSSIDAAS